jgi:hypothetical protein
MAKTFANEINTHTHLAHFAIAFDPVTYAIFMFAEYFFRIEWTHTVLRDYLGFSDTVIAVEGSGGWVAEATYRPRHIWLPTFINADQDAWHRNLNDEYRGSKTLSGRNSGITVGSELFYRTYKYVFEPIENVLITGGTSEQQRLRCAEQFFADSLNAVTSNAASSTKGFYIFHNINNVLDANSWSYDSGGVDYREVLDTPDYYVYAHPEVEDCFTKDEASFPQGIERFDCTVSVHSATAPGWTAP